MPYIHINTNKELSNQEIVELKDFIISIMPIIPGKSIENTMVQIENNYMFFKDEANPCVFCEIRVYKNQPEEAKQEFVDKVCEYIKEKFDIDKQLIYFNILELDSWATNGKIK